jgi:hypothetical protein
LPRCAYIITQSAVSGSRFHLYQSPVRRPGDIGAVAALEHHALDRGVAGAGADFLQRFEGLASITR